MGIKTVRERKGNMIKLLYQGHGSLRLSTETAVIYIDPYAGKGYDLPADLILVTHGHHDHNKTELPAKKPDCKIITHEDAVFMKAKETGYHTFDLRGMKVTAVPAYNKNHSRGSCVGYILDTDGLRLYFAGDTSRTEEMSVMKDIDYAFLPIDGIYNMNASEAAKCAELIGAKYAVPVHMAPGKLFDRAAAERFNAPNRLIIEAGEERIL